MVLLLGILAALAALLVMPAAVHAVEDEPGIYEINNEWVAQAMVEEAMHVFATNGEGAISMMADPANPLFTDGSVYAFLVDGSGTFLAHTAAPSLVGTSMYDITDSSGTSLGELFETGSSPYGGWVSHWTPYANAGYEGMDRSHIRERTADRTADSTYVGSVKTWIKEGWGFHFGASIHLYEDAPLEVYMTERDREREAVARAMVDEAIATYERNPHLAISMMHDPDDTLFHNDELYMVVIHENDTMIAHGGSPRLAGSDIETLEDHLGANLGDLYDQTESIYGRWIEYNWPDPRSPPNTDRLKLVWLKKAGEYKFAAGIYPEQPDMDHHDLLSIHDASRKDAAVAMVQETIQAFGRDAGSTITHINEQNRPLFHDAELYPIVAGPDGTILAHGHDPGMVGSNTGDAEYHAGVTLASVFESGSPYGSWVAHRGTHPESGIDMLQNTLVAHRAGHTFAVGTYPLHTIDLWPDLTRDEMERMQTARAMVDEAAAAFAADPSATIEAVHSPDDGLFRDRELFVVIVHTNGTILGHGNEPNISGTDIEHLRDSRGSVIGDIVWENLSPYGSWVEYYWPNPASASSEGQHHLVWYKMFGDYIFGAGTFPKSLNDG